LAALGGVNRGTHTQLIAYHTIGAWGTGSDDVGLIQRTKAPWHQSTKGVLDKSFDLALSRYEIGRAGIHRPEICVAEEKKVRWR